MNFREYSKARLNLEKEIVSSYEDEREQQKKLQTEIDEVQNRLHLLDTKALLNAKEHEQQREIIRKKITELDLDYTEHGEG